MLAGGRSFAELWKLPIYCEDLIILQEHDSSNTWGNYLDPGIAFGKVLRTARREAKLTQEELALDAGIERNFVSLIERGINQPTVRVLFKLAGALGIPAAKLIELTQQEADRP